MQHHRFAFIATAFFALAVLLTGAAQASAVPDVYNTQWMPAGSGMTHTNAIRTAMSIVSGRGTNWVESVAIDRSIYPDTVFGDNIDHNANWWGSYPSYSNSSWGNRFGNPQGKVQSNYNAAVAALRRGDRYSASIYMGYLSHYLIDINGPMHTEESATEDSALHHALEADAMTAGFGSYIHDGGYRHYGGYSSPSALVVANANSSHGYYSDLIGSYGSGHNWTTHVRDIEGESFNRGVNAIADLIQSAQEDAEAVGAAITSTATTSTVGRPVTFKGVGGCTANHAIVNYQWRSSVSGILSNAASFETTALPIGVHYIYFKAQCSSGKWSPETWTTIVVGAEDTVPLPVYRFLNRRTGVYFYTANEGEKRSVLSGGASTFNFEGVAYALDASSTVNDDPLWRFLIVQTGSHFYTANTTESANVTALPRAYRPEGAAFNVSTDKLPGTMTVWRFYNRKRGVHFFTANESEMNNVKTTGASVYNYEGEAWYFVPPWPITP